VLHFQIQVLLRILLMLTYVSPFKGNNIYGLLAVKLK